MGFDYSGISDISKSLIGVGLAGIVIYGLTKLERKIRGPVIDETLYGDEKMINIYREDIKIAMNEISEYSENPNRTLEESEDLFKRVFKVMTKNIESLIEREENKTK